MSLSIMMRISSSSSSLNDLTDLASSLLKMFKTTPFVMVFCLCSTLYFWPLLSLEWKRLKLSTNHSVMFSIMIIVLSSLSLASLFTSLFWGLSGRVNNPSLFVYTDIFVSFFVLYDIELDCCLLSLLLMHYLYKTSQIEITLFNLFIKSDYLCWEFTH